MESGEHVGCLRGWGLEGGRDIRGVRFLGSADSRAPQKVLTAPHSDTGGRGVQGARGRLWRGRDGLSKVPHGPWPSLTHRAVRGCASAVCVFMWVSVLSVCGVSSLVSWLVFSLYVTQHWTEHTLVGWLVTDGFAVRDAVHAITLPRSGRRCESPCSPRALSEGLSVPRRRGGFFTRGNRAA